LTTCKLKVLLQLFPLVDVLTSFDSTSGSVIGHMSISVWSCCIFLQKFVQISSSQYGDISIYTVRRLQFVGESHETTHKGPFMVAIKSRHSLMLNILETVRDTDIVTMKY